MPSKWLSYKLQEYINKMIKSVSEIVLVYYNMLPMTLFIKFFSVYTLSMCVAWNYM